LIWSKFNVPDAKRQYLVNMLNLGNVRRLRGSYEDAKGKLEYVLNESRSLGMRHLQFLALRQLLRLHRDLGNVNEVERCSAGMLALLEEKDFLLLAPRFFESVWHGDPERTVGRLRLVQRLWEPTTRQYRMGMAMGVVGSGSV